MQYTSMHKRRSSSSNNNLNYSMYSVPDKSHHYLESFFKKHKLHSLMGRRNNGAKGKGYMQVNTFPTKVALNERLSLTGLRQQCNAQEQQFVLLKGKINHLEHEREHCERVLNNARRRYNSILETRTQALNDKQFVDKKLGEFRQNNQRRLSEIKARASMEKSQHFDKVSSFRDRIYTQVTEVRESKKDFNRLIQYNMSKQSSKKRLQADLVRKQEQSMHLKRKQLLDTRSSMGKSMRQEKIISEWNKTRIYIKQNDKLHKKLIEKIKQFQNTKEKANKEFDEMKDVLQPISSKKLRVRDNFSSCSCYTNTTFLTKQ